MTGSREESRSGQRGHVPFALVLAGGGARGLAHAGVLRGLDHAGYRPSMIVGVSMGAIVGLTYALNPDWYAAIVEAEIPALPHIAQSSKPAALLARVRGFFAAELALHEMALGWGVAAGMADDVKGLLRRLTLGKTLGQADPPVSVIATDLCAGSRVTLDSGDAAEVAYASAALAGVFPPVQRDGMCLADGGYSDLMPVDVARSLGQETVVVVDPDLHAPDWSPTNGLQALIRSVEVSQQMQVRLHGREADLVLRPRPTKPITTLGFEYKRDAIAAGLREVRAFGPALREVLHG